MIKLYIKTKISVTDFDLIFVAINLKLKNKLDGIISFY
jgi:hypothetical protein